MASRLIQVEPAAVSEQQRHGGEPFPLVLVCQSADASLEDVERWIGANSSDLLERASRSGAVLLRGFPLSTAEDLDRFIAAFGLKNFPYTESLSNAVRVNRTPRVFTANEAPPAIRIHLHHEMAQTPIYPSRLFFFCEHPAETGGATPICRSDVLWSRLKEELPEFARDCEEKGLRYSNVMPSADDLASGMGRSWQSTLRATTPAEAEARLTELGYSWEWTSDGSLRATTPRLQAVWDLGDGRKSFFNQLIAAAQGWKDQRNDPGRAITFGDGSALDRAAVDHAAKLADAMCFEIPWQRGDVALVDNFVVMHGRRPFTGVRKVLASLIAYEKPAA